MQAEEPLSCPLIASQPTGAVDPASVYFYESGPDNGFGMGTAQYVTYAKRRPDDKPMPPVLRQKGVAGEPLEG